MHILQITNGYADSKVHSNLIKQLDNCGIEQTIYCPVREERLLGKNQFEGKYTKFAYSFCIRSWYKYVYHFKRWMLYRDLKKHVNMRDFDVMHAPTLFSDGGIALKAHREYGIPYVVAVRNTDINLYMSPKLRHTHKDGREIALNASKIYFISKGEMQEFLESEVMAPIIPQIKDKIELRPNGIESYWHEHVSHDDRKGHDILYVGDYTPNKNIVRLAEAILQLRQEKDYEDVRLIIVGGENKSTVQKTDNRIYQLLEEYPEAIHALGKIYDKDKLAEVMHSCSLFAMISHHETFGLVYIEALSQNLPVIYSKGQGIDGIFDDTVGMGVNSKSVEETRNAIKTILDYHDRYSNQHVDFSQFDWENIARKYIEDYEEVTRV